MFFHQKTLKSENNNPWFKHWFDNLLNTQSIVCATVDTQCLEYLENMTLGMRFMFPEFVLIRACRILVEFGILKGVN